MKARRAPAKKPKSAKIATEIHVLNGPNLNMLGFREPELYGTETLADLEDKLTASARETDKSIKMRFFQTNYEGEMLEYIHALVLGRAQTGISAF